MKELDEYGKKHLVAHMQEAGMLEEAIEERQKKIDDFMAWLNENTRGIVWSINDQVGDPFPTTRYIFYVTIEGRYKVGKQGAVGVRQELTIRLLPDPTYRKVKTTEMINGLAREIFGPFG